MYIPSRASVKVSLTLCLLFVLLAGTLFFSSEIFVDGKILTKIYCFVFISSILGVIQVANKTWKDKLTIDLLSFTFLLFLSYVLIRNIFISPSTIKIAIIFSCLSLYVFFKQAIRNKNLSSVFHLFILVFCCIESVYGILQYLRIFSAHSNFPILGSFDNPAGYSVSLAASFPFGLFLIHEKGWKKYLSIIFLFTASLGIVLSESRAGIITICCSTLVFLFYKYGYLLKRYKKLVSVLAAFLIITLLTGLFFLKKDSASGRLLIWNVSANMIANNPCFGKTGSFQAEYMLHQAKHFAATPDSPFTLLADNVVHPFNEYLYISIEYGILGLLLLLSLVVVSVIYHRKSLSPYLLCIASIALFALFSYPFRYPFVWVLSIYSLAQVSKKTPALLACTQKTIYPLRGLFVFISLISLSLLVKDIKFEANWKKLSKLAYTSKTETLLHQYESMYHHWNGNALFLYNYGAVLYSKKRHSESNAILMECKNYFNDYDVQMILAENYFHIQEWENAERHAVLASRMCPNRFLPLHQLSKIYEETNDISRLEEVIDIVLTKPIKVKSPTVSRIILESKKKKEELLFIPSSQSYMPN